MDIGGIVLLVVLAVVVCAIAVMMGNKEREKIEAMSSGDKSNYLFGPINENLVCPHCQTRSMVHMKKATRVATSTGQVGGILKSNTKSTVKTVVTQHHCDQCSSTWDI